MMAVAERGAFIHPSIFQIALGLHLHRSGQAAFERHCETAASADSGCGMVENSLSLFLSVEWGTNVCTPCFDTLRSFIFVLYLQANIVLNSSKVLLPAEYNTRELNVPHFRRFLLHTLASILFRCTAS